MDAMETHAARTPSKDACLELPDIRSVMARGTFDEPTYLYSPSVLAATVHRFIEAFPGLVSYAVKANPRPDVLADIHAAGDPEIGQSVDVGPAHQGRDHAFVGDGDRQRVDRQVGRHRAAVPQDKPQVVRQTVVRMGKHLGKSCQS